MFGKNSNDETDFNIKRLDANNKAESNLEHTVEVHLSIEGILTAFKRVYKEDWTKPRGQANEIFSGHTTTYWINDVPKSQKEYKEKIAEIIPEATFKILSNPLYFNNQIKWDVKRPILFKLVDEIKDKDIALGNKQFEELLSELNNINLSELKKMLVARRNKLNEEFKTVPSRIDELSKQMPEPINADELKAEITKIETEIKNIDAILGSQSENQKKIGEYNANIEKQIGEVNLAIQKEVNNSQLEANKKLLDLSSKIINLTNDLDTKTETKNGLESALKVYQGKVEALEQKISSLRIDYKTENDQELVFDESTQFTCPACNRMYDDTDIENKKHTLTENFNKYKSEKLAVINNDGLRIKTEIQNITGSIATYRKDISVLESEISSLRKDIEILVEEKLSIFKNKEQETTKESDAIVILRNQITTLQSQINSTEISQANEVEKTELTNKKEQLNNQITTLNKKLGTESVYSSLTNRIEELKQLQQNLGQQIADIEKKEFVASEFERKKITTIEALINSKFTFVKFKMFNTLVNGNTEDTCECLVNGVPFSDANTASKLNAGIDVINTLSKHFNICLPLILDNRESVTEIINFEGQLINLIVSKDDEVLRIETK